MILYTKLVLLSTLMSTLIDIATSSFFTSSSPLHKYHHSQEAPRGVDVDANNNNYNNHKNSNDCDFRISKHVGSSIDTPAITTQLHIFPFSTAAVSSSASSAAAVVSSFGPSALGQVQNLATLVSAANNDGGGEDDEISNNGKNLMSGDTDAVFTNLTEQRGIKGQNRQVVLSALESLERDMQLLDNIAASKPQLSTLELTLLSMSVFVASSGPILFADGGRIAEVLAPASAAFSAAIGIGAEYTGRVAVADGKEVAASALGCAAEAEGSLANAERVKAVTPLCVGIGALCATSSLVAPALIDSLGIKSVALSNELYLLSPLVAVLSAAVASLALQETKSYCSRAISVGNRRFAKSGLVGRSWLSASEQIERNSQRTTQRWQSFAWSVLPAPIIGSLVPGVMATKAIIVTAIAAAQSAFYLTDCENSLARATDAVALKARSAAVCDTYANQGARSAAILPFTSALSSLCAAATAAIVELPLLHSLCAIGGAPGMISSVALVGFFPTLSSVFAAAASVSKARCEVDAEAAIQAAATLALEYGDDDKDPILRPFKGVAELVRLTAQTGWISFKKTRLAKTFVLPVWLSIKKMMKKRP